MTRRRPRRVYDVGDEPDPRMSLANERTLLAWLRTALGLVVAGVAIVALGDVVGRDRLLELTAGTTFAGGAVTAAVGWVRWGRVERALRLDQPLPAGSAALVVLATVLALAVLSAAALIGGGR